MKEKKLIGMLVVFVMLVGIAVVQQRNGRHAPPSKTTKKATLLADIDLNAVTGIEVTQGSNTVVLAKKAGIWKVDSLSDYPANFKSLAQAVRAMAEVEPGAPVRTGHVDPSEFGFGKETRRIVLKAGDATVATVEVGARRNASETAGWANQHFVRRADDDAIYLVDYNFRSFSENPESWIDKQILNVRSSDIVSVKANGIELKMDGADWTLVGLDPKKEELQSSEANKPRMALQYLNCKTIADTSKSDAELGFTNAVDYVAQTKDGFTYTAIQGGKTDEDDRYMRFSVSYTQPAAPADDTDQAKNDAFNKTCEANTKRAAELNKKWKGWTYVVASSKAADFFINRDQLAKEKEPTLEQKSE